MISVVYITCNFNIGIYYLLKFIFKQINIHLQIKTRINSMVEEQIIKKKNIYHDKQPILHVFPRICRTNTLDHVIGFVLSIKIMIIALK